MYSHPSSRVSHIAMVCSENQEHMLFASRCMALALEVFPYEAIHARVSLQWPHFPLQYDRKDGGEEPLVLLGGATACGQDS